MDRDDSMLRGDNAEACVLGKTDACCEGGTRVAWRGVRGDAEASIFCETAGTAENCEGGDSVGVFTGERGGDWSTRGEDACRARDPVIISGLVEVARADAALADVARADPTAWGTAGGNTARRCEDEDGETGLELCCREEGWG